MFCTSAIQRYVSQYNQCFCSVLITMFISVHRNVYNLLWVMPCDFWQQLFLVIKLVLPLEIAQSTNQHQQQFRTVSIHEQQVHKNATTYHLLLPNHHLGSHWPVTCFMHLNSISINHFSLDDSSDKLTTSISLSQLPSFPFKYTIAWINGRTDGFRFPFPRTAGLPRFA